MSTFTAQLIIFLGLPVVLILPLCLLAFVATHSSPGVRAQSAQVIQMLHVLWPPFLIMFLLYNRPRKIFRAFAQTVASKLQFIE